VEVDLDALERNLARLRRRVAPARVLAVLKADAYGHGAPRVARLLEEAGVDYAGVALLEEGAELRRAGVRLPILVLGVAQPSQLPLYRRYRLVPTISSLDQVDLWCAFAAASGAGPPQDVHLKVDTGMSRLGVAPEEVATALDRLRRSPGLHLAGLISHFGEADDAASARNPAQERRFAAVLAGLTAAEREGLVVHMANSAAALHRPASRHGLVRVGLALYGLDPAGEDPELEPVMSVVSQVVQVRRVEPGDSVGYGAHWTARRPSRIAVVPVGYADGYAWRLSNRAQALIGGRRVPLAGAVTMDMVMLDVTGTDAALGDPVVLLGAQGRERVTAWELAGLAGTIPYELLCLLGLRMPRRYRRGERCEELSARFTGRGA
jgi:alanine racemase